MATYVAFLRGINLGKRTVRMADLKMAMEEWGYGEVRTLLASGNVVFTSPVRSASRISSDLEGLLEKRFGFPVPVILRTAKEIHALVSSDPFAGVPADKNTRLYISFLAERGSGDPVVSEFQTEMGNPSQILAIHPGHLVAAVQLDAKGGTLDLMDRLDRRFGAGITTRNWNTVLKVAAVLPA